MSYRLIQVIFNTVNLSENDIEEMRPLVVKSLDQLQPTVRDSRSA